MALQVLPTALPPLGTPLPAHQRVSAVAPRGGGTARSCSSLSSRVKRRLLLALSVSRAVNGSCKTDHPPRSATASEPHRAPEAAAGAGRQASVERRRDAGWGPGQPPSLRARGRLCQGPGRQERFGAAAEPPTPGPPGRGARLRPRPASPRAALESESAADRARPGQATRLPGDAARGAAGGSWSWTPWGGGRGGRCARRDWAGDGWPGEPARRAGTPTGLSRKRGSSRPGQVPAGGGGAPPPLLSSRAGTRLLKEQRQSPRSPVHTTGTGVRRRGGPREQAWPPPSVLSLRPLCLSWFRCRRRGKPTSF